MLKVRPQYSYLFLTLALPKISHPYITQYENAFMLVHFLACSTGGRGVDGEERIECAARGYPQNILVTTEKLSSALSVVAERLPGIIIANSIDISGTNIRTEDASIGAGTSCFFLVLQPDIIMKLIQP